MIVEGLDALAKQTPYITDTGSDAERETIGIAAHGEHERHPA